jgi:phospholipid/cholesterol/gamma-HCH transport system substrate-binding protein
MKNSIKIGLVFLGSIVLLYLSLVWGTQSGWFQTNSLKYFIDFENVNGLKISDPVLIRGLTVGTVTNIELKEDFCRVEIRIKKEFPLKNHTEAEIQIKELLSGKQLVLIPKGNQILPEKSILKGKETFDFSFMVSKFGKFVDFIEKQNVDIEKMISWIIRIDSFLNNPYLLKLPEQITKTLTDYDEIALQIKQKNIITKLDTVSMQIQVLVNNLIKTQKNFDELLIASQPIIPKIDSVFFSMDSIIKQTKNLLVNFENILGDVQNRKTIAHGILFEEAFYQEIQKTLKNLNQTLDHIREKRIRVIAKIWGKE